MKDDLVLGEHDLTWKVVGNGDEELEAEEKDDINMVEFRSEDDANVIRSFYLHLFFIRV